MLLFVKVLDSVASSLVLAELLLVLLFIELGIFIPSTLLVLRSFQFID